MLWLALSLPACQRFPCQEGELLVGEECVAANTGGDTAETGGPDDTSTPDDTGEDTGTPIQWQALASGCEPPTDLAGDPLVELAAVYKGQDVPGETFAEIVDLDKRGDWILGTGQGGLMPFDVSDPSDPQFASFFPERMGRYYKSEWASDTRVVLSHRDRGLELVDLSDPSAVTPLHFANGWGYEGLLFHDGLLYTTRRGVGVEVFDLSSDRLELVETVAGLDAPWEISAPHNGVAYIADAALGLVPLDLRGESATLGTPVPVDGGGPLHVSADGGAVFVAVGAGGVAVFETSDPLAPTQVALIPVGGSAVMTSADSGLLWIADNEGIAVWDVSDPADPQPVAREITDQFALSILGEGTQGYVGDWNYLRSVAVDPSVKAPHLEMPGDRFILPVDGGTQTLRIQNLGSDTLELRGASADGGVTVEASSLSLAPGEVGWLRLSYGGGEGFRGGLCVASNDSDQPLFTAEIEAGVDDPVIGQPAPDFVLQDLDGNSHSLSDQLGHPVVLAYFATW
ncbi:MAG: hypothetical protein VX899_06890 [Myxococcota bacterium]|nr:hypothetical protein [Myxococcota bacterium]